MKGFFESAKFKILLAILAVLAGFMIAGIYNEGYASFFSNIFGGILSPVQKISTSISNSVGDFFQRFTDYNALYDENQRLQQELSEYRTKLADYNIVKNENQEYKKLIDTIDIKDDWKLTHATVIARDPQSRFYSFTIDKGTLDGVKYLDPVISSDGLVGYVSEVGYNYANIITILDVKINVGVYETETRDIGVLGNTVEFSEKGECLVKYLPRDSNIKPGDLFFTNGSLNNGISLYPKGIYVGEVLSVQPSENKTNLEAVIKPGADATSLKDVFVIIDFNGKGKS